MIATLMLGLLLSSDAEPLARAEVLGLALQTPKSWTRTDEKDSARFVSADQKGSFELSAFEVSPRRTGGKCLAQLLDALGPTGWTKTKLGGAPAAWRSIDEKPDEQGRAVVTRSYVGCNGKRKWALTAVFDATERARFEALVARVASTLEYGK